MHPFRFAQWDLLSRLLGLQVLTFVDSVKDFFEVVAAPDGFWRDGRGMDFGGMERGRGTCVDRPYMGSVHLFLPNKDLDWRLCILFGST